MLLLRTGNAKEYQEVDASDIAERFGVPLEKLKKTPVFELVEEKIHQKPGQSKEISGPAGASPPASFTFKSSAQPGKPSVTYELRYAESNFPQEKGDKFIDVYEPRKIKFLGNVQFIDGNNEDLLVYMYLFPWCQNSPFKSEAVSAPHWYFKDLEQLANDDVNKFDLLGQCINQIGKYSGNALKILAKGFDITGTDQMIDMQIKSQLLTKAQSNPQEFLTKANSQLTQFKGIAINAVDKGMFMIKGTGSGKAWYWNAGTRNGKVVEVYDNGTPELEQLLQYIKANIHDYFGQLVEALKDENAQNAAEQFLSAQSPIDLAGMFNSTPSTEIKNENINSYFGGGTDEIEVKETFIEPETVFPEPVIPSPVPEPISATPSTEKTIPAFVKPKNTGK